MSDYGVNKMFSTALKNGSATNMAVNGSSTPQVFSYSPGSAYDVEIAFACILAETSNAIAYGNKFIDNTIGTLANGLLLEIKSDDMAVTWQNCKRTRDLIELIVPGNLNVQSGSPNLFCAHLWLPERMKLVKEGAYDTVDYIKATVRDDLRAITYMEMFIQGVKL